MKSVIFVCFVSVWVFWCFFSSCLASFWKMYCAMSGLGGLLSIMWLSFICMAPISLSCFSAWCIIAGGMGMRCLAVQGGFRRLFMCWTISSVFIFISFSSGSIRLRNSWYIVRRRYGFGISFS